MASIVVAKDDSNIRHFAVAGLRRAGHAVTARADGGELLTAVRAAPADLIVTDHQMPVIQGLQAIALLRQDPATAGIPAIVASGSVPPEQARQYLGDADQLLPKPYTVAQVRAAVEVALRRAAIAP
ncbi:response regulator [Dactylosporangium sp. NPDC049140]|uniref:response regulator n=1 Tax=Dactylosporangium sp. NPDC049140 TaxID=3155647 RepID=UPI0033CC6002